MKRLFTVIGVIVIACFAMSQIVYAEKRVNVKILKENRGKSGLRDSNERKREYNESREAYKEKRREALNERREALNERNERRREALNERREVLKERRASREFGEPEMLTKSEYKRDIAREFSVSSSPTLSITNEFGNINIKEGVDDKIIFKIIITGKGNNKDAAKDYAESVKVDFKQSGNNISANTVLGRMNCSNCGRSIDYEVIVPKKTKQTLVNKFGDININNASEPVEIKVEFGKLYANVLSEADIKVQHGGTTVNKCEIMTINSGFSKNKFGEVGSMIGSVSHGGIDVEELGSANLKSDFSNVNIQRLKNSFNTKTFSHGSLRISKVDYDFSNIEVNANFSRIRVSVDESHSFKTSLHCDFGNVNTGSVVFYEKTLEKKDVVVGVVGKSKDPSSTVNISNLHGNISLE